MSRTGSSRPAFGRWFSRTAKLTRCLLALVAFGGTACLALEGGRGPAEPSGKTPFSSVGSLSVNGQLFSGVLIGPQHVLTAAHIAGSDPAKIVFRSGLAGGMALAAQWVLIHPEFNGQTTGNSPGDPSMHADLAVIKLTQPVPASLRPARLSEDSVLGRVISLVSHGGSTSLVTEGENRVDLVFPGKLGQPATYMFDFDGPDISSNSFGSAVPANGTLGPGKEASLVKGDSGSAAFIKVNGQWLLAGINTFQINIGPNRGAGGMVLSGYRSWINEALNANPPERVKPPPASPGPPQSTPLPPSIPFKP